MLRESVHFIEAVYAYCILGYPVKCRIIPRVQRLQTCKNVISILCRWQVLLQVTATVWGGYGSGGGAGQHVVINDPNRLVPVQITIPAQQGNPSSQPRALTVQVPAHALQTGGSSGVTLQQVLTQAISQVRNMDNTLSRCKYIPVFFRPWHYLQTMQPCTCRHRSTRPSDSADVWLH